MYAYSPTLLVFTYNHRSLLSRKETTESYLISPYTYDGLQDVSVAYLADYEKGLVAPYYLQMPLTAEQKKAAMETVEDTISSPNQKETIVARGDEETEEIDTSVFVPACELSRKLLVPELKYITYHIYWNNETEGKIAKSSSKK